MSGNPIAIEVRDVAKSYRVPGAGARGLRQRLMHPVDSGGKNRMKVLNGVSFSVERGEMFALLGRNGCGKSTLLRMIASIYEPDAGTIKVAGQVAPLIELGVGFDPELTATQNVVLNGVMLGMEPRSLQNETEAILEFAELREFGNMPLKNFSSGMRLRLAFAIVIQTKPDVLLVDEIFAVGDAGFQQKCTEALLQLRSEGATVVLVSHDMEIVQRYCDRAMLIERGSVEALGAPDEVVRRYFELTLEHRPVEVNDFLIDAIDGAPAEGRAEITELSLRGATGARATVAPTSPIEVQAVIDAKQAVRLAGVRMEIRTEHGARVYSSPDSVQIDDGTELNAGEQAQAQITIENRLSPGAYRLNCVLLHSEGDELVAASPNRSLAFQVDGVAHPGVGIVSLDSEVRMTRRTNPLASRPG